MPSGRTTVEAHAVGLGRAAFRALEARTMATLLRFNVTCLVISAMALGLFVMPSRLGLANSPESQPDWPTLCQQAVAEFREITPQDVQRARDELLFAVKVLDARLDRAGPEAEGWRDYLLWRAFSEELKKDSPSLDVLGAVYQRLSAGHEGLGLTWFRRVRLTLERFLRLSQAVTDKNAQANYQTVLNELGKSLAAYESDASPETATRVQELLRWLETMGQAKSARDAVLNHFSHPNVTIRVSGHWISISSQARVDVREPVREWILGTDVRGTGHMVGWRKLQIIPCEQHALFAIRVEGVLDSDTIGYNGPARIYSHSKTPFVSQKLIQFGPDGLTAQPARCDASVSTDIQDVDVTCRSQCVEKIAWRRTFQQKPAAEREAAWKAERRIARRVDQEADERLAKAQSEYLQKIREPLADRDLFPDLFLTKTTADAFHVTIRQMGHSGLAAGTSAPQAPEGAVVVQVHQSFVNNFVEGFFGGMVLKEARLQEAVRDLLGELPKELESDPDGEPWTIRFSEHRPLAVRFADNQIAIEFRGTTYWKGDRNYPGMDVKAAYRIESLDDGKSFRLVRQGPLAVFPPNFDPSTDRLSVRQQTIRRLLERRFEKIFRDTIELEPIKLSGDWEKGGPLAVKSIASQKGWLTVALDQIQ